MNSNRELNQRVFHWLMVAVSAAFLWILLPLYGAILWALVISILFQPIFKRFCHRLHEKRTPAALATVVVVLFMVILPLTVLITSLAQEASSVYDRIQSGDLNFGQYFQQIVDSLPGWASSWLDRLGLSNLVTFKQKLGHSISKASQTLAVQALNIGQNTFHFFLSLFVMLYLLFFLLRDGEQLYQKIRGAVPLEREHQIKLFDKFIIVIRATLKGTLVVALLQGSLGGLIFWILGIQAPILWGALMSILSLFPAVGAALVWVPVAIYLLATGATGRGVILLLYGMLVISLVDNFVRPFLVGKDTKMPDYVALVSTLGGIAVFGVNGFVLGPVIAAMFIAAWDIFASSRSASVDSR